VWLEKGKYDKEARKLKKKPGGVMKSQKMERPNSGGRIYRLTGMEMKVLRFIPDGWRRKEIAIQLNLSVHTVDFHLDNAYKKLRVHNGAEAVAKLLKENILSSDGNLEEVHKPNPSGNHRQKRKPMISPVAQHK